MTTVTYTRRREYQRCPDCKGVLSVGKHRHRPTCFRCQGRGFVATWVEEFHDGLGTHRLDGPTRGTLPWDGMSRLLDRLERSSP